MSIKRLSGAGLTTPKSNKLWDQTTFQSGMFAIATVSLTSTAASVTFSGIPADYKHLQIREISQLNVTGASKDVYMRFNSDTAANYSMHVMYGNGASALASPSTSATYAELATTGTTAGASVFSGGIIDILDYADTNKYKTTRSTVSWDGNGTGVLFFYSGNWRSTSAISTITLTASTGSFTANSHFALYGIKGA
jgi:hypothetical protein